jgi:hypothetical protein
MICIFHQTLSQYLNCLDGASEIWEKQFVVKVCLIRNPEDNRNFESYRCGYESNVNPLTPELNLSVQRCLTRFFAGDFAS